MNSSGIVYAKVQIDEKINISLGAYVKECIERDYPQYADVLLNYPVVYVHTWKEGDSTFFYVGETIDVTQRTNEHDKGYDKNLVDWHNKWKSAVADGSASACSYFFSGKMMNKSLCLDVENELISRLRDNLYGHNVNGKMNPQGNYSNSYIKDAVVDEIWNTLREDFPSLQRVSIQGCETIDGSAYPKITNNCTKSILIDLREEMLNNEDCFRKALISEIKKEGLDIDLFLNYPVVYFHKWMDDKGVIRTYVGEANNVVRRTLEHYQKDLQKWVIINGELKDNGNWGGYKESWKQAISKHQANMFVFANPSFNKSVTLDIENRLIQYTIFKRYSVNGRTNEQREYCGKDDMFGALREIIGILHKNNEEYFPSLEEVKKKSVFICSPFMKLTDAQQSHEKKIREKIIECLSDASRERDNEVIIVHGGAGTGKTVLVSSLFFDLLSSTINIQNKEDKPIECHMVVNHDQLSQLYTDMSKIQEIADKDSKRNYNRIWKAQSVINSEVQADVVLIDEAHLLAVKGKEGTVKPDQLPQIISRSKVTALMYDEKQHISSNELIPDGNLIKWLGEKGVKVHESCILDLSDQMRMECSAETKAWIDSLSVDGGEIRPLPYDPDYTIEIMDSIENLEKRIKESEKPACLIATYDWNKDSGVEIGNWSKDWFGFGNKKLNVDKALEWIEGEIDKVGYVRNVQGFDLKYAGVILGPSVKYQDGRLRFMKKYSGGSHKGFLPEDEERATKLIADEVGVLLTRGIKGVYIFAADKNLRIKLKEAVSKNT